jgi:serine phosphatase RsbU (regulator of sigma subunit)
MSKPVILCVDDEKMVLNSLKFQLKKAFEKEYEIEVAESGEEALEIIEELLEDRIDLPLVISDQIMPTMKGDQFLIELHQKLPATRKIMLTGQADTEAVGRALNKAKLYRFMSKPWDAQDLELTAGEALLSFSKDIELAEQNRKLKELNENLEEKVKERTAEVVKQKEIIEKKNNDIISSINYAKRIQRAMLPPIEILNKNLPDNFIFWRPRDIVSGDFYWFVEKEDRLILAVVDCTGHGVPGAIMSMVGMEQLTEVVEVLGHIEPDKILEHLHIGVRTILKQDSGDVKDGMDLVLLVIDKKNGFVEYAGAKNPLVYTFKNDAGEVEYIQINGDKNPIGGHQHEDKRIFTKHIIPIDKPLSFYLFTDGYQDQFGGLEDRKFMIKRMKEMFRVNYHKTMKEQLEIYEKTFDEWLLKPDGINHYHQIDDVLMIGFKI